MGLFDVRCALSGLILQSGRTLVLPLVRQGKKFVPLGLPIAGSYDRYGRLDPIDDDAVAMHFAKTFVAKAEIDNPPKRGLKPFVDRLVAPGELAPSLDGSTVKIAYLHEGVYRAFVAHGARDKALGTRLAGKRGGALFDGAFAQSEQAQELYAGLEGTAARELDSRLREFAQSGLGHEAISPVKGADYIQASPKQLAARLAKARKELAKVFGIAAAFDDYERRAIDDEKDENPDALDDVKGAVRAALLKAKLGLKDGGEALERSGREEAVRLTLVESESFLDVHLTLWLKSVGVSSTRVARMFLDGDADHVSERVEFIVKRFDEVMDERRGLLGALPDARLIALAKGSHWYLAEVAAAEKVSPSTLIALSTAMRKFPFNDYVRRAWCTMLARKDCPPALAKALADHSSHAVRVAAAKVLAR